MLFCLELRRYDVAPHDIIDDITNIQRLRRSKPRRLTFELYKKREKMTIHFLLLMVLASSQAYTVPPSSWSTEEIAGIWRLTRNEEDTCLILRLKEDMTFCQYDDKDNESLQGIWDYRKDNTLVLSMENTMLLEGKLLAHETKSMAHDQGQVELHLSVEGQVSKGTFLYPRHHPSYFDLYQPTVIGEFSLRQVLGKLLVRPREQTVKEPRFQPSEFYGKKFWLTVSPVESKRLLPLEREDRRSVEDVIQQEAVDIRLYSIDFFANNTFCATGANKLLRGRFDVSGEDHLWFQVSLFGSGRSVSGSVYR